MDHISSFYKMIPHAPVQDDFLVKQFVCYECGQAFRTTAALRKHKTDFHQTPHIVRLYASGTCCLACGTEFHAPDRLIAHLQLSRPMCLMQMIAHTDPLNDEQLANAVVGCVQECRRHPAPR